MHKDLCGNYTYDSDTLKITLYIQRIKFVSMKNTLKTNFVVEFKTKFFRIKTSLKYACKGAIRTIKLLYKTLNGIVSDYTYFFFSF